MPSDLDVVTLARELGRLACSVTGVVRSGVTNFAFAKPADVELFELQFPSHDPILLDLRASDRGLSTATNLVEPLGRVRHVTRLLAQLIARRDIGLCDRTALLLLRVVDALLVVTRKLGVEPVRRVFFRYERICARTSAICARSLAALL